MCPTKHYFTTPMPQSLTTISNNLTSHFRSYSHAPFSNNLTSAFATSGSGKQTILGKMLKDLQSHKLLRDCHSNVFPKNIATSAILSETFPDMSAVRQNIMNNLPFLTFFT